MRIDRIIYDGSPEKSHWELRGRSPDMVGLVYMTKEELTRSGLSEFIHVNSIPVSKNLSGYEAVYRIRLAKRVINYISWLLVQNDILCESLIKMFEYAVVSMSTEDEEDFEYDAGIGILFFRKSNKGKDPKQKPEFKKYFSDLILDPAPQSDLPPMDELLLGIYDEEQGIAESDTRKKKTKGTGNMTDPFNMKPSQIKAYLDKYVISQEEAKKVVSVAVYNHYKCIKLTQDCKRRIKKNNILIIGPTGSGKSEIAKTIADMLHLPYASISAASCTAAGYVGEDLFSVFVRLYRKANNNVELAQRGIVFIDEFDKIAAIGGNGRDIRGEDVQFELLKALEGANISFKLGNSEDSGFAESIEMNTKNILFICAGAFSKMPEMSKSKKTLGFTPSDNDMTDDEDISEKLIEYGIIPELVGRLPVVTSTKALSEEELARVLVEPENSIVKQYKDLFEIDGIQLDFDDEAIGCFAHDAIKHKTGARALQSVVEKTMMPIMFSSPDMSGLKAIRITKECVAGQSEPVYEFTGRRKRSGTSKCKCGSGNV